MFKRSRFACQCNRPFWILVAIVGSCDALQANEVFVDNFSSVSTITSANPGNGYQVTDESFPGAWRTGKGRISYSRGVTGSDPDQYRYASSILLTTGASPSTGSPAGLSQFTVATTFYDIPSINTAQPGLIVTGSASAGGYLLEIDNGQNTTGQGSPFVLRAESGPELTGDEGSGEVVANFGIPKSMHDYAVSVTENRNGPSVFSSIDSQNLEPIPSFRVSIFDLTDNTSFYDGIFVDSEHASDFGGTQIGFRVRDPLDADTPTFGPLSLAVPEPIAFSPLAVAATLLLRRAGRID